MKVEENPFWVWTPEDISAERAVELFVNPFTDFFSLESPSHMFIHGPRGSGKSMMFRMMRADCARLRKENCELIDLDYLGIYVPTKKTEISQTEMVYLDRHPAKFVFNEHIMCLYFAQKIFDELASDRFDYGSSELNQSAFLDWARRRIVQKLTTSSSDETIGVPSVTEINPISAAFLKVGEYLQGHWEEVERLIRQLPLRESALDAFNGNLLSYHGFLVPLLGGLSDLGIFPKKPIYLLIDDADNLSLVQTQILNSWIAARTTGHVCIKASTQMRYKTRLTYGGQRIEAPHDFHEVDVSVLYTTNRDHYLNRLRLIVERRLASAKLRSDPREFFPEDPEQAAEIERIAAELTRKAEDGDGRGNRPRDDANRYARPEFIRELGGVRKSRSTYSYSGFEQLAHISSGVVRWFLEPAARMFAEQLSLADPEKISIISSIDPHIQDKKIREFSIEFFQEDFEKLKADAKAQEHPSIDGIERERDYQRLEFLINAMGNTFFRILVDRDKSERRVFSIALSDRPDPDVQRILSLGVEEGYLHRATIGSKRGHGRTSRYVLCRRLAPYFRLDPTSFSGYLFVTNENLRQAMHSPTGMLRNIEDVEGDIQMELPIVS